MGRGIYVEARVAAPMDRLGHATQDPDAHASWDLRFSSITHLPTPDGEPRRFRYDNRTVPLAPMTGVGVSLGERHRPDGSCTSALRFSADSRLSPIASGDGYWRYVPDGPEIRFFTGYDYVPGWQGALLDRVLVRPAIGWMTAWSFDRLRLWLDHGISPAASVRRTVAVWAARLSVTVAAVAAVPLLRLSPAVAAGLALVVLVVPSPVLVPQARRCLRRPPVGTRPTPPTIARAVDEAALGRARRHTQDLAARPGASPATVTSPVTAPVTAPVGAEDAP